MQWSALTAAELLRLSDEQLTAVPMAEWRRRLSPDVDEGANQDKLSALEDEAVDLRFQVDDLHLALTEQELSARRLQRAAARMYLALTGAGEVLSTGRAGEAFQLLEFAIREVEDDPGLKPLLARRDAPGELAVAGG